MISPDEVKKKAKLKEGENYSFRTYLKIHADPEKLDEQFLRLHNDLFSQYDCSKCRNCCKEFCGMIPEDDVEKDAEKLNITREEFIANYLEYDESEASYKTKHCPCDFLNADGSCTLEECKPDSCSNYPYTNQPDRMGSLLNIVESAGICPVVYEILEGLKEEYHFIKRRHIYPNEPCPCGSGLEYKKCCGK